MISCFRPVDDDEDVVAEDPDLTTEEVPLTATTVLQSVTLMWMILEMKVAVF